MRDRIQVCADYSIDIRIHHLALYLYTLAVKVTADPLGSAAAYIGIISLAC